MNKNILSAVVVGAHGIRGYLKMKCFLSNHKDLEKYSLFDLDGNYYKCFFKFSQDGNRCVVGLDNINSRNDSEKLKGKKLYIKRSDLPNIESDDFYYCDINGMKIVLSDRTEYGSVVGVNNFGAGDVVEIKIKDSNKLIMLPVIESIFKEINITEGYAVVEIPEFV